MELAKFIRPYPCRIGEPKTPQQEMFKIAYPCQRTMIEEAACVILPYFKQKYPLSEDKNGYGLMDYGAAWALVENMRLAATAEGLGAVVHIPVKKEPEQIKEFLKVPDGDVYKRQELYYQEQHLREMKRSSYRPPGGRME